MLKDLDPNTDSHTYVGRDYVRLTNGYKFTAVPGKTMNAKTNAGLTQSQTNAFLNVTTDNDANTLTTIDKTKAVGQIPISSSVSPSGAKCYNVPIEIVPGRQGFQPNISLSYNSQAGNGLVGIGWSISGLSSIERVNKNLFFDGKNDIPALSKDDGFALDGVRLIKNETTSTDTQFNYETVTGNTRVIAYVTGNIVKFFKVFYPNGTVGIMGYTDNTVSKLLYPVTTLTDMNGSVITFSYTLDTVDLNGGSTNETYYIDEINYGKYQAIPDFAKVKFGYDVTRPDLIFSLQSSKSCVFRKRLSKIESFANPDLIRTYQLSYSNTDPRITSNQNDVSRLTQISSFINNGTAATDNLNPLKFYYGDKDQITLIKNNTSLDYSDLTNVNFLRGKFDINPQNDAVLTYPKANLYGTDANSGGITTLVYPAQNSIKIFQNIKTTNSESSELPDKAEIGLIGIVSGDINGDNSDEIIKINSAGINSTSESEFIKFKVYKASNGGGVVLSKEVNVPFVPYSTS
ncbi:MAG: SpvB/TcaC N-terminal domain-containing protein, partial [Opitutaceae bacterium]